MAISGLEGCHRAAPGRRVIVVDDEPSLVDIFTQYLNLVGLQAIGFTDGRLALDLLNREKHSLLVTDLMMPDLNGLELVEAAKAVQPELKVLLVSGVDPVAWPTANEESMRKVDAFLAKPMPLEALSNCCQRLLAGTA